MLFLSLFGHRFINFHREEGLAFIDYDRAEHYDLLRANAPGVSPLVILCNFSSDPAAAHFDRIIARRGFEVLKLGGKYDSIVSCVSASASAVAQRQYNTNDFALPKFLIWKNPRSRIDGGDADGRICVARLVCDDSGGPRYTLKHTKLARVDIKNPLTVESRTLVGGNMAKLDYDNVEDFRASYETGELIGICADFCRQFDFAIDWRKSAWNPPGNLSLWFIVVIACILFLESIWDLAMRLCPLDYANTARGRSKAKILCVFVLVSLFIFRSFSRGDIVVLALPQGAERAHARWLLSQHKGDLTASEIPALFRHLKASSRRRNMFAQKYSDTIYQNYVLMPVCADDRNTSFELSNLLRQATWLYGKREKDVHNAAATIVRRLRSMVSIVSDPSFQLSIPTPLLFTRGIANRNAWEGFKVSVLRSAGIPSRMGATGVAEIWVDGKWRMARTPPEFRT